MSENIKRKDADRARDDDTSLEAGLEGTFPASDPVSATRARKDEKGKDENGKPESGKPEKPLSESTRPRRSDRKSAT